MKKMTSDDVSREVSRVHLVGHCFCADSAQLALMLSRNLTT